MPGGRALRCCMCPKRRFNNRELSGTASLAHVLTDPKTATPEPSFGCDMRVISVLHASMYQTVRESGRVGIPSRKTSSDQDCVIKSTEQRVAGLESLSLLVLLRALYR